MRACYFADFGLSWGKSGPLKEGTSVGGNIKNENGFIVEI
jgi:hypothetical protein